MLFWFPARIFFSWTFLQDLDFVTVLRSQGGLFLLGMDDLVYVGTATLHDYLVLKR